MAEARRLLFDRLVDLEPEQKLEVDPRRTDDREGLRASVRSELGRLFNTRAPLRPAQLLERQRTVIDYGIPDPLAFSAENDEDRALFARHLELAIAAYEPRLRQVRVACARGAGAGTLEATITATLRFDRVDEPIAFPTLFSAAGAEVRGP
jgi:type VI secretion system lysozyme-like protein